jgi:Putative DNA-binding domain
MFNRAFDDIAFSDVELLVDNRIAEGRRLEYKSDHYGKTDEAKREFAADISAMANAFGGDIVIGVTEENGIASQVSGVKTEDPNALILAVTQSIHASIEPPIHGIRIRWIEISNDAGVLLIRVPRSWSAPHRVIVVRDNRFFLRDENGKHPMSTAELRRAFLFATEVEERIRNFRSERLNLLSTNEGPLALVDNSPRLIFHVAPLAAFTEGLQISVDESRTGIQPLGARTGWNSMYSVEGLVTYSGPEERFETVRAFTTLFRRGIVEAAARINTTERNGMRFIGLSGIEQDVIRLAGQSLSEFQKLAIPAPFYFFLSLVGVRGLSAWLREEHSGLTYPHRADSINVPELEIDREKTTDEPEIFLRPLFDLMWNAFGQRGSPNYDGKGSYIWR